MFYLTEFQNLANNQKNYLTKVFKTENDACLGNCMALSNYNYPETNFSK